MAADPYTSRSPRAATLALTTGLCLAVTIPAFAGEKAYRIKRTDIAIPDGASLGEVRRTFHPFPNWTLICDENLKVGVKICNVTQNFVDANGAIVFSWSLAATEKGSPVFILRGPASLGPNGSISVLLSTGKPLAASVQACDIATCIATLPLGSALRAEIARREPVTISYLAGDTITLLAPLNGLAKAIAAID